MDIDGSSILVTGGAGLIGSSTIDQLLQRHDPRRIVVFDNMVRGTLANLGSALEDPRVTLVRGDVRDAAAVRQAMQGMDAVIHMAALRITACAADPREAFEVMCEGSFNVVDAARQAGLQKVVAASSASVYGLAEQFPTTERHHPYNNRTIYGALKVFNEGLLRSFNDMYGLNYVALRYFNVYGPRMDIYGAYTEVLIRWMDRILEGKPPLIFGDGTQTMDFIYVKDIARANILAAESPISDEVFNIACSVETSLNDLAYALMKVMDVDMPLEYGPERKVNPVPRRLADTSSAREKIGFTAQVQLESGLSELVDWWRTQKSELAV